MNDIKESLVTSIFNWFPNFSSIFNSTEIKGNVEKNFNVDVDKFLSSLTEINSTLSGHIVLILDQVYAGKFSDTLNLVLDRISEGIERYFLKVTTVSASIQPRGSIFQNGFLTPDYHIKNA